MSQLSTMRYELIVEISWALSIIIAAFMISYVLFACYELIVEIIKALSIMIAAFMISYVLFACFLHQKPHPIMLALSACGIIVVFARTFEIRDCLLALIACVSIVVLGFFFVMRDCFALFYRTDDEMFFIPLKDVKLHAHKVPIPPAAAAAA
jgi:hypothetical protein